MSCEHYVFLEAYLPVTFCNSKWHPISANVFYKRHLAIKLTVMLITYRCTSNEVSRRAKCKSTTFLLSGNARWRRLRLRSRYVRIRIRFTKQGDAFWKENSCSNLLTTLLRYALRYYVKFVQVLHQGCYGTPEP